MKHSIKIIFSVLLIFLLIPMVTYATTIPVGFKRITSNNAENVEGQLGLNILDPGDSLLNYGQNINSDQVLFAFTNNVGTASNISEIYLDDGTILGLSSVLNSLGGYTNFTGPGVIPANLPSGDTVVPPFVATVSFSADTDSGDPGNGINQAADILGIVYQVSGGIAGVQNALNNRDLRVGLHVRSIGLAGGSDSFVNTTGPGQQSVPEPGTLLLLGFGLLGLPFFRKKRG